MLDVDVRKVRARVVAREPVASMARWRNHRDLLAVDRLLASYPKSGNTWLRFMVGQVCAGRPLEWDELGDYVPMVDRTTSARWAFPDGGRIVKTHHRRLRRYRVPSRQSVYIVRDGRDVAVSYYHHQRREGTADGEFGPWLGRFLAGSVDRYGSWADHVRSWSAADGGPEGCMVVRYERMLAKPVDVLGEVLEHLGIPAEPAVLALVVEAHAADRLREREARSAYLAARHVGGGSFVRAAGTSSWRDTFTGRDEELFWRSAGGTLRELGYEP